MDIRDEGSCVHRGEGTEGVVGCVVLHRMSDEKVWVEFFGGDSGTAGECCVVRW